MNLLDEDFSNNKTKKTSNLIKIIIVFIVLIVIAIIGIVAYMMYLQGSVLRVYVDDMENADFENLLVVEQDGTMYVPIRAIANYLGYNSYNGEYSNKSEDNSKCYVECEGEAANLTLNSNKIYKLNLEENDNNYTYVYMDKPVKAINGELYITTDGMQKAFNASFFYDQEKNRITIYTTQYLINAYTNTILNYGYTKISDVFENEKAVAKNMLVVTDEKHYGVINPSDGTEILECKYDDIRYQEATGDFIVCSDDKYGIIGIDKKTKVTISYDSIELMDYDAGLYLVSKNSRYGVIDLKGNNIIYAENDQIGVDISRFEDNDLKTGYILVDNLIPVMKNSKWGLFDTKGNQVVEFEYDRQQTEGPKDIANNSSNSSRDYVGDNQYNSNYTLNNIDLGLTERPKAQLEIDKSVANVKVTLANNTILFDINEAANNALWQDHKEYSIDEEKMNSNDGGIDFDGGEIGMYDEYYTDEAKHRYSFRDVIDTDIMRRADKGLIQLTMDEELMHGATIQVTYTVKITNVGEVDYVDGANKNFYYKGDTSGASVATTTANQVVDYVANNFQFNSTNATNTADGWTFIEDSNLLNSDLVNARLTEQLSQFNTIIETENFGEQALLPGQEISKTLILSQLITPENTDDDLTYNNMVEIVKTSNTAGRRMAYSVVGNQDPTLSDASEVDTSMAERIVILPPFGCGDILSFCAIALAVGAVLVVGIVLIRRKVLKGKNS